MPEGLVADSSWRGHTRASLAGTQGPQLNGDTPLSSPASAASWGLSPLASVLLGVVLMSHPPPSLACVTGPEVAPPAFLRAHHFQQGGRDGFSEELRP